MVTLFADKLETVSRGFTLVSETILHKATWEELTQIILEGLLPKS